MKALVTGINGFVGPYLKDHLLKNGIQVFGMDINQGADVNFTCDLLDRQAIFEAVKSSRPDLLFHLAGQSSDKLSFAKPELTFNVNVLGTKNILDAVRASSPDCRILIVSSANIYGIPVKVPLTEQSRVSPISPYGESKLKQEELTLSYGLSSVIVRTFPHTGPGQIPIFVCSDLAKQAAEAEAGKRDEICVGNTQVERDFSDVRDIVRAYLLAVQKCRCNEIYNVCSGKSYSVGNVFEILKSLISKDIKLLEKKEKKRERDILILSGDNSKFVKQTGWKPEISFEKTLGDLLDYWRQRI
ncbi:MAG TPA: GDP-mannose 4,6-dehydratase [Candidatus Nanoarchaeia archaeon]|nr:GDP-mannose 4,6-dehydratase [Candidatus Nanoarchaeia archaeon]